MSDKIQNDPLAKVILLIIESMKKDFIKSFQSVYSNDDELRHYKRRLYDKLRTFSPDDIADGYELFFDQSRGFCPTVPEMVDFAKQARKLRKQKESHNIDVKQREEQTNAVKINIDPLKMLVEAREASILNKGSGFDREEVLKAHAALLTIHAKHILKPKFESHHQCAVSFCQKLGVTSSGIRGDGLFYCAEHAKIND